MAVVYYHKEYGETLAGMRDRFRKEYPEYKDSKLTYAGRLDPMASGLMIILTGDDVYTKDNYTSLDKTYEVDFILGLETDTYDVLGMIKQKYSYQEPDILAYDIQKCMQISEQEYPPFSSKTIQGKPLWQHIREGTTHSIKRPVTIYKAEYIGCKEYTEQEFQSQYLDIVAQVQGDFRQDDILARWREYQDQIYRNYRIHTARFSVSSGTYIRSLVHTLGKTWGTGAISLHIRRTHLGDNVV